MSLEAAIERNTEALNTLIGILTKGVAPLEAPVQPALSAPETKPAAIETKKAEKAEKTDEPSPPEPTYQDAVKVVNSVVRRQGTAAAKTLLTKYGAENLKQVPPNRYAELIDDCWKALLA